MSQLLQTRLDRETATGTAVLQETLVELIDLSLQAKQAHWNIVGPLFKPLHELLDDFTEQYRAWYDDVAERIAALDSSPDGQSTTIAATTPFQQLAGGRIEDRAVIDAFDARVTDVAARVRGRADALGETDLASQDLLVEIVRGLEKQRWMIRAHRA